MTKDLIVFIILVFPISGIILGIWYLHYQNKQSHTMGIVLGGFLILMTALFINRSYFQPMILLPSDIVGQYVIDTSKYPGPNADWQYEHYRFTITADNLMIFESKTDGNHWSKEVLPISYSSGYYDLDKQTYCNKKLRIHSHINNHHIVQDHPTLYRKKFNTFYYVFHSEKYGNVFFKKGNWKP